MSQPTVFQPGDLIILHVTAAELDAIVHGLNELPHKIARSIIDKLVNQANGGQPAPGTPASPIGPVTGTPLSHIVEDIAGPPARADADAAAATGPGGATAPV